MNKNQLQCFLNSFKIAKTIQKPLKNQTLKMNFRNKIWQPKEEEEELNQ
jgi:hypothetical protein